MKFLTVLMLLFSTLEPTAVARMDWNNRENLEGLDQLLEAQSEYCGSLGYLVHPRRPGVDMPGKIEGFLFLQIDASAKLASWQKILAQLEDYRDSPNVQRMWNAGLAAVRDPDLYAQAQEAYVSAFLADDLETLSLCDLGARDVFIREHYWSGSGSLTGRDLVAREAFADFVAELKINGR